MARTWGKDIFHYDTLCPLDGRTFIYDRFNPSARTFVTKCDICTNHKIREFTNVKVELNIKIYDDENVVECAVCLDNVKNTVFIPCGHFYTCSTCSSKLQTCPICKKTITETLIHPKFN